MSANISTNPNLFVFRNQISFKSAYFCSKTTLYAAVVFGGGAVLGFTTENQFGIPPYAIYLLFFVFGDLLYVLCDILYVRLAHFYIIKIRHRIRKYLK